MSFIKFNKFILTNISGTVVDTVFLWLLSNTVFDTYFEKYVIAPAISFEIAVFNNYTNSYFWVWKERVLKNAKDFLRRLFFYNINSSVTLLIRLGLILFIEEMLHFQVVYCNLIALLFTGILNYFMQDKLIFKQEKKFI